MSTYSIWIYKLHPQDRRLYEVNQSSFPPFGDGERLELVKHYKVHAYTSMDAVARVMSGLGYEHPLPPNREQP